MACAVFFIIDVVFFSLIKAINMMARMIRKTILLSDEMSLVAWETEEYMLLKNSLIEVSTGLS